MKSIKLIVATLIAAALSFSAQAGEITFKATDGQVFGTKNAYMYEMNAAGGGFVRVTVLGGNDNLFVDGASLAGRIVQNLPQLVNVTGTNTYIDPTYAVRVACSNGNSIAAFPPGTNQVQVSDNCSMFQQIQAKAK